MASDFAVADASGKFVTRLPRSLHQRLTLRARAEGVSLNALVMTLIAEGLGQRSGPGGL
jgi:antitoxin HicB